MIKGIEIEFRIALREDLPTVIALLMDDALGHTREGLSSVPNAEYLKSFEEIERDPNNEIIVGLRDGVVVAVLQLTYIPSLSLQGTQRVLIEGVRVSSHLRGEGIGRKLLEEAFTRARARGCTLAQLTTNKIRTDAIRFYEGLGFQATHQGMKLKL